MRALRELNLRVFFTEQAISHIRQPVHTALRARILGISGPSYLGIPSMKAIVDSWISEGPMSTVCSTASRYHRCIGYSMAYP